MQRKHIGRFLFSLAIAAFVAAAAMAQTTPGVFRLATGAPGGTYDTFGKQIQAACKNDLNIALVPSTGAVQNIDILLRNISNVTANAGFTQLDASRYKMNSEDAMAKIKTLVNLYPESVHLIALQKVYTGPQSSLNKFSAGVLGDKPATFVVNSLSDLHGKRIGAAGGSFVTAKSIQFNGQFQFDVQPFETNDLALKALEAGQVDAVLMVGGHPLAAVEALDKAKFKLLPVDAAAQTKISAIYKAGKISYPKLDVSGMPTVYTNSAIIAGESKNPETVAMYRAFRQCVLAAAPKLAETGHKQWRSVADDQATNADARGAWNWLDLQAAAPAPAESAATPVAAPTRAAGKPRKG